ncbi:MAG TPA: hypothetical protein VIE88_19315, partial [Vicinamibacteria bacterium]
MTEREQKDDHPPSSDRGSEGASKSDSREEAKAEEEGGTDVLRDRREKLERLRSEGIDPFPHDFAEREEIGEVRAAHEGLAPGVETDSRHRVAGRIVGRRG